MFFFFKHNAVNFSVNGTPDRVVQGGLDPALACFVEHSKQTIAYEMLQKLVVSGNIER